MIIQKKDRLGQYCYVHSKEWIGRVEEFDNRGYIPYNEDELGGHE